VQAIFTLTTTTFTAPVAASDTQVIVASTSGIVPGVFLFANRELFKVVRATGIGNAFVVLRGQEGTHTRDHGTGETIYLAQGYQLFVTDPQGLPPTVTFANPHINVVSGTVWVVQGDDLGPGTGARSWQPVTTTQTAGALGVRVTTVTTPS
jgi:hypothetical protein